MHFVRAMSIAAGFVLLGTMLPAYAQHDHHGDNKGGSDRHEFNEHRRDAHGPEEHRGQPQRQQHAQPSPQQHERSMHQSHERRSQQGQRSHTAQQRMRRTHQQAIAWQQQRGWLQKGGWEGRGSWQQHRAQHWERDHRTWGQRGGYGGYYIPRSRFSVYFGSQHWFRIHTRPVIYMGYPRFTYGGFSFMIVDPWPEYWTENWYETDDVFVDYYDDGYYLCNRRHPSVRIAISVVL